MSLILDGTNGLSDVDGSASTPAIRGTDTNTGIFFPAADTIAFSEGGAEVARFDSSGILNTSFNASINGVSVGRGGGNVSTNTAVGASALNSNTTGSTNTAIGVSALAGNITGVDNVAVGRISLFASTGNANTAVGEGAGGAITTGNKNTILGRYNGNQGGLDIRTSSNNIVLSDGDGSPAYVRYSVGNVSTSVVDISPTIVGVGGLHYVTGFNTSGGAQAWWLIATRVNSVTIIASSNATGLTVTFGQTASVRLNAVTSSGTINMVCTTIS